MMRALNCAILLGVLSPIVVTGQEFPKYEIFSGYSYLRGKGAAVPTRADENSDMNGWNLSVVRNFNNWFAVVADFSGHYDERVSRFSADDGQFRAKTSKNMHLFLVGPRFSFFKTERFTPFAHSLIGVARARTTAEDRLDPFPPFKVSNTDVGFAADFGVGLDIRLSRAWALRLVQADYILTRLDGQNFARETKENLRLSTGISFRFGH